MYCQAKDKAAELKDKLEKAVKAEDFIVAAQLKDKIDQKAIKVQTLVKAEQVGMPRCKPQHYVCNLNRAGPV